MLETINERDEKGRLLSLTLKEKPTHWTILGCLRAAFDKTWSAECAKLIAWPVLIQFFLVAVDALFPHEATENTRTFSPLLALDMMGQVLLLFFTFSIPVAWFRFLSFSETPTIEFGRREIYYVLRSIGLSLLLGLFLLSIILVVVVVFSFFLTGSHPNINIFLIALLAMGLICTFPLILVISNLFALGLPFNKKIFTVVLSFFRNTQLLKAATVFGFFFVLSIGYVFVMIFFGGNSVMLALALPMQWFLSVMNFSISSYILHQCLEIKRKD